MKKNEISVLNVLFCLMVIFIHITAAPVTKLDFNTVTVKILYSVQRMCGVAVHGFVFLSGLKLFLKDVSEIKYSEYVISRFKKIFLPYFIITVLYYLFEVFRGYYSFDIKNLIIGIITGNVEAHLYFVFVIMQFYMLFPLWRYLIEKFNNIYILILIALIINILCVYMLPKIKVTENFSYNHGLFTSYLLVWIIGCLCGKYYDEITHLFAKYKVILGIVSSVLLISDVYMSFNIDYLGREFFILKFIRILYLVSMISFLYGVFIVYKPKILSTKLFVNIDNASFAIYLFHVFVIYIFNDYIKVHLTLGELKSYLISLIFVYSISISACIYYKKIIGRLKL